MNDKEKIIVIGSGGQAEVVIDILQEMNKYEILGLTTNEKTPYDNILGVPVLGDDSVLDSYFNNGVKKLAMAVGGFRNNTLRKKLFLHFKSKGFSFVNAIHPFTSISRTVSLGEGVIAYQGVVINTKAVIGDNCILALNSSVGHSTTIESHSLISAGANVGADAVVGSESLIAIGAKIVSGAKVGKNVLVAAGAVVVNDIPDNVSVFGIPAKVR